MKSIYLLLLTLLFGNIVNAQYGSLDLSFGNSGITTTNFEPQYSLYFNQGKKVLQRQDGSYYVLLDLDGKTTLQHYFENGTQNQAFATGGYGEFLNHLPQDAVLQPDGKIVTAGSAYTSNGWAIALARHLPNGSLDPTFGSGGQVLTPFPYNSESATDVRPNAIALQADGRIVVAGRAYNSNAAASGWFFALARYTSNGALDDSFGSGGRVTTPFPYNPQNATDASAQALSIQNDGKILLAGKAFTDQGWAFAVSRYTSSGSPDGSFGSGGRTTTHFFLEDQTVVSAFANSIAVQDDGKLVAAGYTERQSKYDDYNKDRSFALVRYNSNGTIDASFGVQGRTVTPFSFLTPNSNEEDKEYFTDAIAKTVRILNNGKILVAGSAANERHATELEFYRYDRSFALAKYNTDGSLDQSFGKNGLVTTDFTFPSYNRADVSSLAVHSDGKITVVGSVFQTDKVYKKYFGLEMNNCTLVRYLDDGSLDQGFGENGIQLTPSPFGSVNFNTAALQSDGKLVMAGKAAKGIQIDRSGYAYVYSDGTDFALARYSKDGTLDTSFGEGGKVKTGFDTEVAEVTDVLIQKDQKIVAAGWAETGRYYDDYGVFGSEFALSRYNADGTLDPGFGAGGTVKSFGYDNFPYGAKIESAFLQNDDKILAIGRCSFYPFLAMARYNADGTLDPSFGAGGTVLFSWIEVEDYSGDFFLSDYHLQADEKVLATDGRSIVRFDQSGKLDQSFGKGGILPLDFSIQKMLDQADGKILVVGNDAIVRLNSNGTLDNTFNGSGIVKIPGASLKELKLLKDGRILVAGDGALHQFKTDGTPDQSFGAGGTQLLPYFIFNSLYIQQDGKILGAHQFDSSGKVALTLLRLNSNGSIDGTIGYGGSFTSLLNATINGQYLTPEHLFCYGSTPGLENLGQEGSVAAFRITASPEPTKVASITLVNASTNQTIQTLSNGAVIDLSTVAGKAVNIRANTSPELIGSVIMKLTGTLIRTQVETIYPYLLFGDVKGVYNPWVPAPGTYSLTVTPYTGPSGTGIAGTALTVNFTFVDNSINRLPIASAGANQTITLPINQVALSGSGSDPDGTIAKYTWTQVSGPNTASFSSLSTASPTVSGLIAGTYVFGLRVTDNKGGVSEVSYVTVTVKPSVPTLSALTLVNTTTDKDVAPLVNGMVIDLSLTPGINIRADVATGTKVGSVRFALNGNTNYKTESAAPFAIAGDNGAGDYYPWPLAPGTYTITATPYAEKSGGGAVGTPIMVTITIKNAVPTLSALTLVNTTTDKDVAPLVNGMVIDLSLTPGINIRADVATGTKVGSVRFALNGNTNYKTESAAPFAIAGDNGAGDYYPWLLAPGTYTITATPYAEKSGGGAVGTPLTYSITVRKSPTLLSGLSLMKGGTTQEIGPLVNGAVIDLAVMPNINVRANPLAGAKVGSVRFGVNSTATYRMESAAPFALAGDNKDVYYNWPATPGVYTITATPYTESNGGGIAGTPITVTITIRQAATIAPLVGNETKGRASLTAASEEKKLWHLFAYPNPVVNQGKVEFSVPTTTQATVSLVDVSGRVVQELFRGSMEGGVLYKRLLYSQGLARGVYQVRLRSASGKEMSRQLIFH